jgi:endogenous inhibitor of DNA gyrase (YacG/DUF329 family)
MSICPICGEEVTPRSANKAFPFCTARCKSIDLGKWLNQEYRVPETSDEAGEGGERDERSLEVDASDVHGTRSDGDSPGKPDMRH